MGIKDYYRQVIHVVEDLTGITEEEIIGRCRSSEIVDARWLATKLLSDAGYYSSQIASVIHRDIRQVQWIVANFEHHLKFADPMARINYDVAAKRLRGN